MEEQFNQDIEPSAVKKDGISYDPKGEADGFFKAFHPLVQKAFNELDNYLIIDEASNTGWCCVYFSSNGIYFPSDEATFRREILEKNRFEFYGTRLRHCSKHIFVRDIHKQWYLQGISNRYNSIEKVAAFLKKATEGYHVITLGSSAGGYAAALFATLINAEYAICVDAQFTLYDETIFGQLEKNPIVSELKGKEESKYFRLNDILGDVPVYYFCSVLSEWDRRSLESVKDNKAIRLIPFKSSKHGGPFNTIVYDYVFDLSQAELEKLTGKLHHPSLFLLRYLFHRPVLKKLWHRLRKRF